VIGSEFDELETVRVEAVKPARQYSIATGFYAASDDQFKQDFFHIWYANTIRHADPVDVFVINAGSRFLDDAGGKWLNLSFNLGHVHDLDANCHHHKLGGWSMSFLLGAMTCYANKCDFVYKEQDCLAFGDWVGQMYRDLDSGNKQMLLGRAQDSGGQGLEQSLFIIRHAFIVPFVARYLDLKAHDGGPRHVRPEMKFKYLREQYFGGEIGDLSFGYGRSRPSSLRETIFYIQQVGQTDLDALKAEGRL